MKPLWDYATAVYGLPQLKQTFLRLQDQYHIDVNATLWCLWCARYGIAFAEGDVERILSKVEPMAQHATRPLRTVRLFLSSPKAGFDPDEIASLRAAVLDLEIRSEKLVLCRLDDLTREIMVGTLEQVTRATYGIELFTLARELMDTPTLIADEEGPSSPNTLFRTASRIAEDYGP